MKTKDVVDKAYGSVPREVGYNLKIDLPLFRGFKYYYLKVIRFFR